MMPMYRHVYAHVKLLTGNLFMYIMNIVFISC